jgi:hypothetical protein
MICAIGLTTTLTVNAPLEQMPSAVGVTLYIAVAAFAVVLLSVAVRLV